MILHWPKSTPKLHALVLRANKLITSIQTKFINDLLIANEFKTEIKSTSVLFFDLFVCLVLTGKSLPRIKTLFELISYGNALALEVIVSKLDKSIKPSMSGSSSVSKWPDSPLLDHLTPATTEKLLCKLTPYIANEATISLAMGTHPRLGKESSVPPNLPTDALTIIHSYLKPKTPVSAGTGAGFC